MGMIRIDFPGFSGGESLEEISWDDWFEKFDERNLALLVQDETAQGRESNFNKLVSRDSVGETDGGLSSRRRTRRTRSEQDEETERADKFASDADLDEEADVEEEFEMEARPVPARTRNASVQGRARQRKPTCPRSCRERS